jgi:hypothetical protein
MQKAGLVVSQLKFSDFLMENFGENLLGLRREREQSLQELLDHQKEMDDEEIDKSDHERADAILATFSEWDDDSGPQEKRLKEAMEASREPLAEGSIKKEVRDSLPTLSVRLGTDNKEHIASRVLLIVIVVAVAAVAALAYFYFK